MSSISPEFISALFIISSKIFGEDYAIRGTTSLVLQGLDMGLEDIDILCDGPTAVKANDLLKEYLVKSVEYSESSKFKSYFGEFNINGVKVEIMGDWQIKTTKGIWSEVHNGSNKVEIDFEGSLLPVTTIDEELKVFIEMGRWNAYHKIKKQLPSRETTVENKTDPQLPLF
jgi:hypothetical protein